jgi:hypothetical protein
MLPKLSQVYFHVSQLEPGIQDYRLLWPDVGNNLKDNSSDHITYFHSSDITLSFCLLTWCSLISGLTNITLQWMLDLWRSYQIVFVETGSSKWMLSSAATIAAVVLWLLDAILFNVRWSLSLSFGFQPLFLLADDIFPWFMYSVITLETAALDTPNKMAILVTCSSQMRTNNPFSCKPWKVSHFAVI